MVAGSADVTAQAVITADRRFVRLSIGANFAQVTPGPVQVINPIVPRAVLPGH
jgi:hypothetical protein